MPAKRRDEPRFKSFLGRVFTLRKYRIIPGRFSRSSVKVDMKFEEFGQAVFVLDESNSLVRVCKADGSYAWIPKYYLHKEIKNGNSVFQEVDGVSDIIQELLSLAEDIKDESDNSKDKQKDRFDVYTKELQRLANSLRQYADKVNPIVPKKGKNGEESGD